MITIDIEFYHHTEDYLVHKIRTDLPDDIVFDGAESTDVNYINARPFEVTDGMKNYAIEKHPDLAQKFEENDAFFIGRHNVPEGY